MDKRIKIADKNVKILLRNLQNVKLPNSNNYIIFDKSYNAYLVVKEHKEKDLITLSAYEITRKPEFIKKNLIGNVIFGNLEMYESIQDKESIDIRFVQVKEEYQQQGIGSQLVRLAEYECFLMGAKKLTGLSVISESYYDYKRAINFNSKLGFEMQTELALFGCSNIKKQINEAEVKRYESDFIKPEISHNLVVVADDYIREPLRILYECENTLNK